VTPPVSKRTAADVAQRATLHDLEASAPPKHTKYFHLAHQVVARSFYLISFLPSF
jgi:hypothetical protein